jgi:hypothetical protein
VDLNWSGGGITGPANAILQSPFTVRRTYTISGAASPASFTIAYYASLDTTLGNADDILLGTETISAAADLSAGVHSGSSPGVQLAAPGAYYLFARVDSGDTVLETDETNNTAQAPQPVTVIGPVVLDNGGPGYAETGSGWTDWAAGYNGGLRFHAAGSGANTASWQMSGLPPGTYTVQATWNGSSNHPSNAPYSIYDGNTLLTTVLVDQRPNPSGVLIGGVTFQTLGTVQISSGTLRVVLSDNCDGYVVADAVRIVPVSLTGGGQSIQSSTPQQTRSAADPPGRPPTDAVLARATSAFASILPGLLWREAGHSGAGDARLSWLVKEAFSLDTGKVLGQRPWASAELVDALFAELESSGAGLGG